MDYAGRALSWRHRGPALEVELHHAPLNEIGTRMVEDLEVLVRYLAEGGGGARALIFWSSRPGFCAGADLRELYEGLVSRRERWTVRASRLGPVLAPAAGALLKRVGPRLVKRELARFLDRIHAILDALDGSPIPTIAAVHGVVFGGGFELALATDVIVADRTARFCFPELRLGLVPGFGGVPRLSRDLGNALVRDLLLSGRSLNAARAHEVGLVGHLVPKGEALDAARRLAEQAARFDPAVVGVAKRFAKPIPRERLDEEKRVFLELVTRPAVLEALDRFVHSDSVRPYLPPEAPR